MPVADERLEGADYRLYTLRVKPLHLTGKAPSPYGCSIHTPNHHLNLKSEEFFHFWPIPH